jgi:uncharacterized protein (TIGR03435 family)
MIAIRTGCFAVFVGIVAAQPGAAPPAFEAGDIRVSPHSASIGIRGGYYPAGGRYELHQATLADLIRTAWNLEDNNRVIGGPAWLDDSRFDVFAQASDSTSRETARLMLRTLLEDRFQLVVHEEKRPLPAYVLTAGKRVLLKAAADETSEGKCQNSRVPAEPGTIPFHAIVCGNVTMDAFAKAVPGFASDYLWHIPMVDQTGLKGGRDFSLKWHAEAQLPAAGSEGISLVDAVDKQLGLRLEMKDTPLPVIAVDHASERPTESSPETLRKLPRIPTEFEVGTIKPSPPEEVHGERILPGGEVDLRALTLKELVLYAWDISGNEGSMDELLVAPKWLESARFDVIAKASSEKASDAPPVDEGALRLMMRNLLLARFRMAVHYEDRPVTVYSLTGAKAKLTKADPATRTSCKAKPMAAGSKSALTRNFVCQNVTMSRFAEKLRDLATDYLDHPVVDATGLQDGWNFTLSFSPHAATTTDARAGAEMADPDGKLSLFDAMEKQLGLKLETRKSPLPVLVIDRVEQQPAEN